MWLCEYDNINGMKGTFVCIYIYSAFNMQLRTHNIYIYMYAKA